MRIPSLLDPGRGAASREDALEPWFEEAYSFLRDQDLLNDPVRLYNIDETWYSQQEEKRKKVVVSSDQNMPYRVYEGRQDHITFAMCVSAAGTWFPTMFIYKGAMPRSEDFHTEGPSNALYKATESGHIDADSYFEYIKHLDQFLSKRRPIVIFQDNHSSHMDIRLIEYCVEKQIHLYNLPPKSSHLIQPLDKIFGPLKTLIEQTKQEAMLVNPGNITKSKVPALVRFAMNRMKPSKIKEAFEETGIFPLNSGAIDRNLLLRNVSDQTNAADQIEDGSISDIDRNPHTLNMEVFDENGVIIIQPSLRSISIQTKPIESLPCSECIEKDVSVHPAVRAGIVPIDLATAFIGSSSQSANSQNKSRFSGPKIPKGQVITHGLRLEAIREKKRLDEEKENQKRERALARELKRKIKEDEKTRKRMEREANKRVKKGFIKDDGKCRTCRRRIDSHDFTVCVLCETHFHSKCYGEHSFVTVCATCELK